MYRLAVSLSHGEWLGKYDHLTLAKGPADTFFMMTYNKQGYIYTVASLVALVYASKDCRKVGLTVLLGY